MNSHDLIETAVGLTELSRRRPAQSNLRRAVSTAYYAVFHCLARAIADTLMGKRHSDAWHRAYRSLGRADAKKACQNKQAMKEFPAEIRDFAGTLIDLQKARERADYALEGQYYKLDVLAAIDRAKTAIAKLDRASA